MTKEYLVVHDLGQLAGITIEPAGKTHTHSIECWALDDGAKILFAKTRLGPLLKNYHVGGSFYQMAMYGLSYDELVQIATAKLGPCDRARYSALVGAKSGARARSNWFGDGAAILGSATSLAIHVAVLGLKLLLVVVLFPFVIMFLNRHGNHRRW